MIPRRPTLRRLSARLSLFWALAWFWPGFGDGSGARAQDSPSERKRPTFSAEQLEFFEKQVRPILVHRCYDCHDPANGEPGGGLSLVSRVDILAGGDSGPAIEPGDPVNSLLIEAVRHGQRVQMPPDEKIPLEEIATLMKWIEQKAPWPLESDQRSENPHAFDLQQRRRDHWAWQPPLAVPLPTVQRADWPRQSLDFFILQRLEAAGLSPAPAAAPLTWLRRVHLDLIGLPPTAEQVLSFQQAWAATESLTAAAGGTAREQLQQETVDRLLADPRFGEHWARHWLDLVRYAETCGHEFDYPLPGAYHYRDYIIRAFNQDLPYDQWVVEHVAGDLLRSPRRHPETGHNESALGTMFWFLSEANHAPVDVRGDQANRIDNQIDVFGKTFLGLTVSCARCHDHKFDAISAADYYALAGIVAGTRRHTEALDRQAEHAAYQRALMVARDQAAERMQEQWSELAASLLRQPDSLAQTLQQWLESLPGDATDALPPTADDHPLRLLHSYAKRPLGQDVGDWWADFRVRVLEQEAAAEKFRESATLLTDFSPADRAQWWASGLAFSPRAWAWEPLLLPQGLTPPGPGADANASADQRIPQVAGKNLANDPRLALPTDVADSSRLGWNLAGTLRSPTFRLTADRLHVRVRGQNAKLRLVIDGYQMNLHADLLFSQTLVPVQAPQFEWRTMAGDIGKYVGHTAYLELIDEGDGFIAVDQVWMGGDRPVLAPSPTLVKLCRTQETLRDLEQLATVAAVLWAAAETGQVSWPAVEAESTRASDTVTLRETSGRVRRWNLAAGEQAKLQQWIWNWSLPRETAVEAERAVPNRRPGLVDEWPTWQAAVAGLSPPPPPQERVYIAAASEGLDHPLYIRGNARNPGDPVPRGPLTALQGLATDPLTLQFGTTDDPSGRWQLALNTISPEHPLTARVMVNRLWLHLLGEGLVPTPDDFGVMGTAPTHLELLDHLALRFIEQGWSIKQAIRQIVLSQTYAQSLHGDPAAAEQDPTNQLWHRATVKRLSGEVLRDAMLQISGRLDPQSSGPSVPAHVTDLMQGRGRPASGPLDGNGRRSIYLEIRRNFLNPWMLVFDTPAPFSTMGKRNRSNVPAQALALMNDPLVHELATQWARQVVTQHDQPATRLQQMFLSALGRPITAAEEQVFLDFLAASETQLESPADPVLTWQPIAHAIFNLKEFVFLE